MMTSDEAFNLSPIATATTAADLTIISANMAWRASVSDQSVGLKLTDFVAPENLDETLTARAGGTPAIMLGQSYFELRVSAVSGGYIVTLVDVTARTLANESRDAANRGRAYLLDAAGVTGHHYNPETDRHSLTEEFAELLGRPGLSFTSEELLLGIHPADRAAATAAQKCVVEEGVSQDIEIRTRNPEGGWAHIRLLARPGQRLPSGQYEVLSLTQDVSSSAEARDRAEAKARQLSLALRAATAAVYEVNMREGTVDYSPEFEEITGATFTFEDVMARRLPFDTPDGDAFKATQRWENDGNSIDLRVNRRGEERWIRIFFDITRAPNGETERVVGLILDIDESKRQELALQSAQAAAEAATEAKSRFLASMSHEIRTPMNGVVGVLHLLKQEPVSEHAKRMLDEALTCSDMLSQLINDVLDFSKIEAGKLEINRQPSSIKAAVDGVFALLRPQATAKGLLLTSEVGSDVDWAMIDPVRLRQCLFNLVGNGVKFTDTGQVSVRVTRVNDERIQIHVTDTGAGVPVAEQSRLFQRFEQIDIPQNRSVSGTGLGLAITRNLIELMGGRISYSGNTPRGSVFSFDLNADRTAEPSTLPDYELDTSIEGMTILLVDDNSTNCMVGSKILEALGAQVVVALNGADAISACQKQVFDVLLMDINMPGMDGIEATRRIRELGRPGSIPILALTANVMAHQRESYLAAGMDGVIGKPLSPSDLLHSIVYARSQFDGTLREAS